MPTQFVTRYDFRLPGATPESRREQYARALEQVRYLDEHGADPVMLGYLFEPGSMPADKYGRASSQKEGAWSILTGIAANTSIAGGGRIDVDKMLADAGIVLER